MSAFDEQPDDPDPHGECAWTIRDLTERLKDAEARCERLVAMLSDAVGLAEKDSLSDEEQGRLAAMHDVADGIVAP